MKQFDLFEHDDEVTFRYGFAYGPKGNRLYDEKEEKPRVLPAQPGSPSRRNLDHMPK